MSKKVSVIIPARNEEDFLEKAVGFVRKQDYENIEIIVVVNGSTDQTLNIAKRVADKVVHFENALGYSVPRNEGAKVAQGEILLFLDADTQLRDNVVSEIVNCAYPKIIGTCLYCPDANNLKAKLFIGFKNLIHRTGIFKSVSVGGVMFCDRELFFIAEGFNPNKNLGEFYPFVQKALKRGGRYKYLTTCLAVVSMRRFEEKGYLATLFTWIRHSAGSVIGGSHAIAEKYILK